MSLSPRIKKALKIGVLFVGTSIAYRGSLAAINLWGIDKSEKITSQKQLEEIGAEEHSKLNCDKKINYHFETFDAGASWQDLDYKYHIEIGGDTAARSVVKHELYHVCKGHIDWAAEKSEQEAKIGYWLWGEPTAALYGTFDINF